LHVYSRPQRSNICTRSSQIQRWLTSAAVSRYVHNTDMSCVQQCHGSLELRASHYAQQRRNSHVHSRKLRVHRRDVPSRYQRSNQGSFLGSVKELALVESLHLSRCVITAEQRQDKHCTVRASSQQWQYIIPSDSVHVLYLRYTVTTASAHAFTSVVTCEQERQELCAKDAFHRPLPHLRRTFMDVADSLKTSEQAPTGYLRIIARSFVMHRH
jgi:hypothetical protein